nr:Gp138 family membrane-puncturing spike protein [Paenibacillus sp. GSMTC-2017]
MHVAFPCKVISYQAATNRASLQPLTRTTNAEPAIIEHVSVLGQRYMINGYETTCIPYVKAGDIVLVVCSDRELKNAQTGKVSKPDSSRMHDVNDAVIVGVFPWSL